MRRAVNEIRMRDQRGGETYDRPIERRDEYLRMGIERIRNLEAVGYDVPQDFAADVDVLGAGRMSG